MHLLRQRFENPAQWQSFQPYWQSLPEKVELFGMYAFQAGHVRLLQDAKLV